MKELNDLEESVLRYELRKKHIKETAEIIHNWTTSRKVLHELLSFASDYYTRENKHAEYIEEKINNYYRNHGLWPQYIYKKITL